MAIDFLLGTFQPAWASVVPFLDCPYTPTLLLDGGFDVSLTDESEFRRACEWGFESYSDEMYELDAVGGYVFVERRYTLDEVLSEVLVNVLPEYTDCPPLGLVPLAWRVGFLLGRLSALHVACPCYARVGLCLLRELVALEQAGSV